MLHLVYVLPSPLPPGGELPHFCLLILLSSALTVSIYRSLSPLSQSGSATLTLPESFICTMYLTSKTAHV